MTGRVLSVNVGALQDLVLGTRLVRTGIFKEPVEGPRRVADDRVEGDVQGDPSVHGGPDKAVYAYASEDTAWWEERLGRGLPPGTWGENLTLAGVDVTRAIVGSLWRVGTATLRVTSPRIPCSKLAARLGDPHFVKQFVEARRPGTYLAVEEPGEVAAGDTLEVVHVPGGAPTVQDVFVAHHRLDG